LINYNAVLVGRHAPQCVAIVGLQRRVSGLHSAPFRVGEKTTTNTVSVSTEGVVDPAHRAMRVTRSEPVAGKSTGTDVYLRFEQSSIPGVPAGRWMHVDGRRLRSLRGRASTATT
jgi:hypothetical protein